MNTQKPTKEGELLKYKNMWLGWGTRYFKLERMYLHYFESKDAPTSVQTVTRGDISEVKVSGAFPAKQNVFEIHTKSGLSWYLQATSQEEMVLWMKALNPNLDIELYQPQVQVEPSVPPPPLLEPNQGPYTGPQPHIYPNLYIPGQPLYNPNAQGCSAQQHSPPPSYEESSQAAPLPAKSR